ncbi:MAG: hypothetical protein ABIQ95_00695, partial [Bdellovibrionia bacterium]
KSKLVVRVAEMSSPPAIPGATGWPSFSFTITPKLEGQGNACAPVPEGQSTIAQTGFFNATLGELPINNTYLIDSVTWLDSTFSNDGSEACHAVSAGDFTNASGMAALHTGVFVQALWMKLQEVIDGLIANNYLNVTMPKCRDMATQYKTSLKDSMNAFFNLSSTNKCTTVPEGCGTSVISRTVLSSSETETATNSRGVSTCATDATILLLQSSSVKDIAVCEIYERAQSLFNSNMNVPTTTPGTSESAMAWVDQLRNYAVTSCMNRNPPFSNSASNCGPYCMEDLEAAAMGSLLALSIIPFVGLVTLITLIALLAAGADFDGPYLAAHLNNKSYPDVQREMTTRYSSDLATCFPYAYSLFFNSYLKTKVPEKMNTVPIQGLKSEGENATWTSPSGKITISGCQMNENAPNPGK